ncbi:SRPBCC family protein [Streptomyces sp. NBC_01619]|uniref:SRPBCC family protein n=1 Tax=Streptomyces pratisoli TaxID=3139917 RepID=A0ACC6QAE0_9ACTN|nr:MULTISPECIES: SRPBCC family protein [unclassified Streptomyces]MCX4510981.1 SRPBCC family protein [Streptomyces sp. NBC_01619]
MNRGTFIDFEGRPAVRFERSYPHPVERVWAAVSEPEGLAHWFPSKVRIEPHEGGKIEFSEDPNLPATTGTVLVFEPPHRLAFTWEGDEIHLEVTAEGEGCRLALTNVLAARNTAARNAAGWSVCLTELDRHLAGARSEGPHSESAEPWKPYYDAYVSEGMPSGAEIPGAPSQES